MNSFEFFSKTYLIVDVNREKSYFSCLFNISQYLHLNILEWFSKIHNLRLILDEKYSWSLRFYEKKIVIPLEGFSLGKKMTKTVEE